MRKWAEWGPYWCAGLNDAKLGQIDIPSVVTPGAEGYDDLHPCQPAAEIHKRLPNAEFVDWKTLMGDNGWQQLQDGGISEREGLVPVFDVWERFIAKAETG